MGIVIVIKNKSKNLSIIIFLGVCVHFVGTGIVLPPYGFLGSSSGGQGYWQVPSPTVIFFFPMETVQLFLFHESASHDRDWSYDSVLWSEETVLLLLRFVGDVGMNLSITLLTSDLHRATLLGFQW